jgi:hypothetical protein
VISSQNYSEEEKKVIKILVAIGGGCYMGEVNFLTTHIICDYFSTSQESDWNRTATCPKILSLDWLVRTFQFKRSINEELYFTKGVADHRIDVEIPEYNDMPGKNFKFEYLPVEEIQDA